MHCFSLGNRYYDVSILWELSKELPVIPTRVTKLKKQLTTTKWDITPSEILDVISGNKSPKKESHVWRINNADLKYPILLTEDGTICDGLHRLCKAMDLALPLIDTIQFPTIKSMAPARIKKPT